MAALAALSAVTMGASSIAKTAKAGSTLGKTARYVASASGFISNTASFLLNAGVAVNTAGGMYDKYIVQGRSFDSSTSGEFLTLGISLLGCAASGRGMTDDAKALGKLMQEDRVASRLAASLKKGAGNVKAGISRTLRDNRGSVDLSAFGVKGSKSTGKVYYHVTTQEYADEIIATGKLGRRHNSWECRVFAWTEQPTKKQASVAGIGKDAQTVIKFNTNASFEPDVGNLTTKSIKDIVVQTTDGQRVPISVKNVEIVGFKKQKGWWQFWKK